MSGLAFRDRVQDFTGIDVAENMLVLAREKQLYDGLHCVDIIDFLHRADSRYDLALAADVFVYLGELATFFSLIEKVLQPEGFLLFSIETCAHGYALQQSGRYAHSLDYIAGLAAKFHFTVVQQQTTGIRYEREAWIPGELYVLRYLGVAGLDC